MKRRIYLLLLFLHPLLLWNLFADDIDLGSILVSETRINNNEVSQAPNLLSTIIEVEDNPSVQNKSIGEIISQSTGIFVKKTGSENNLSTVSIRGSSSKNVLILLDGVQINDATTSNGNINMIPTSLIKKIEITRGGASSIFGSSAMGGVINIITKEVENNQIRFFISDKSFRAREMGFNFSLKNKKTNFLLAVNNKIDLGNYKYLDDNGTYFNKQDDFYSKMNHNKMEKSDILLKNSFNIDKTSFGYSLDFHQKKSYVNGPSTFKEQYKNAILNTKLLNTRLVFDSVNLSKFVHAQVNFNYKYDNYIYDNSNPNLFQTEHNEQTTHSLSHNGQVEVTAVPLNNFKFINSINYDYLDNNSNSFSFSTSISDEITPVVGLTITPVTRLEYYSDLSKPITFVWNLGLAYQISEELKLKTNGFKAFRKPNFTEMYYKQGLYIGNPDLQPETSYGGDFAVIYNHRYFDIEGAIFCTYYQNLISYILSSGFVYRPINSDQVLSYGVELDFNLHIIKYFSLECNYTLNFINKISDLEKGNFIQQNGHPKNSFFTKLSFDIWDYHFGVSLKVEDEIHITYGGKTIPCKGMLDAFLRIDIPIEKIGLKPSIFINANNLLNIYTSDERNYPLEGRNFEIGFILTQKYNKF